MGLLLLVGVAGPGARAQGAAPTATRRATPVQRISVEGSPQLFATMSALYAAGYDAQGSTSGGADSEYRSRLLAMKGPATEALRAFYKDHALADAGETLSQYVSFALVVGPPPRFSYQLSREELPPDALALEGFDEILANFYKEAGLDAEWQRRQPIYNREAAALTAPVSRLVEYASGYAREIIKPSDARTFAVVIEPLVHGRTNFRSYGDRYTIVVASGTEAPMDDIRHAFLHFLLNPLPVRDGDAVLKKKALLGIAARAPRLPAAYQQDFIALMTECLVRAVELRLRKLSPAQMEAELASNDRDGWILVRPLVQQLRLFEKAEPAMELYFPDMLAGIDVAAEQQRLQKVQFAEAASPASTLDAHAVPAPPSELERWLTVGEHQIAAQDARGAASTFERVLAKYPGVPRAIYGLAIASVLLKDAGKAKELLERLVAKSPPNGAGGLAAGAVDPALLAWAHVYLGRIHEVEGDRELALSEYRAALAVEGAPDGAHLAAQHAIDNSYKAGAQAPHS